MTIEYGEPGEGMIYVPPFFAGLVLADRAFNASSALDMIALAVLLAGVFAVARYKAALSASEAAADAWEKERDAALSRASRVTEELVKATAENSALKARPDLVELTDLVRSHGVKIDSMADRIVAAIEDSPVIASTDLIGIAAVVAALGTLLTGIAVVITAARTNQKVDQAAVKLAEMTAATSSVTEEKLDEIHVLVNSRLTEALDKIERFEKHLGLPPGTDPSYEGGTA